MLLLYSTVFDCGSQSRGRIREVSKPFRVPLSEMLLLWDRGGHCSGSLYTEHSPGSLSISSKTLPVNHSWWISWEWVSGNNLNTTWALNSFKRRVEFSGGDVFPIFHFLCFKIYPGIGAEEIWRKDKAMNFSRFGKNGGGGREKSGCRQENAEDGCLKEGRSFIPMKNHTHHLKASVLVEYVTGWISESRPERQEQWMS